MVRRSFLVFITLLAAGATADAAVRWREMLRQPDSWYGTPEAIAAADAVLLYQTESGGWPKNHDLSVPPTKEFLASTKMDERAPTIDNDATTTPMWLLARVHAAHPDPRYAAAFLRGFDYLLASQYENGGFPQYFPLQEGYYTHITYNDNAMVNALELLRDASRGDPPVGFVDAARRRRAADAVARGTTCILRTQVKQNGVLTVWCAQHDEKTLEPAWARNFEPPSLSGEESVGIVRLLMAVRHPSPEIVTSVESAIAWFKASVIHGLRVESSTTPDGKRDRHAVADPQAPDLWARFYELAPTNRPIFTGRDRIIRYDLNAIEQERRAGYSYLGSWPAKLLAEDYPRWRAVNHLP